jgi:hypothetical protein
MGIFCGKGLMVVQDRKYHLEVNSLKAMKIKEIKNNGNQVTLLNF